MFGIVTLISLLIRYFLSAQSKKDVVLLYGHKLNSNLKGVYDYVNDLRDKKITLYFLTMDPVYYHELKESGVNVILATRLNTVFFLAKTKCIVSDHGLHSLNILLKVSDVKFVDVWHGIPFKGFDADDFKTQRQYDEVWVTSALLKKLYIEKFGFPPAIVFETGYARTDVLINQNVDIDLVKSSIGISDFNKKVILFAPTWQQDENNRNIFPFSTSEESFFGALDTLCEKLSVLCVFRAHLNTAGLEGVKHKNILFAPHSQFPDTEDILLIGDVMVCDWSSIAFDFLLLDRPTVFLDIPAPFKKGFSLDESYRFGEIVKDFSSMLLVVEESITEPYLYWQKHGKKAQKIKRLLYDDTADGFSGKRCFDRLNTL